MYFLSFLLDYTFVGDSGTSSLLESRPQMCSSTIYEYNAVHTYFAMRKMYVTRKPKNLHAF